MVALFEHHWVPAAPAVTERHIRAVYIVLRSFDQFNNSDRARLRARSADVEKAGWIPRPGCITFLASLMVQRTIRDPFLRPLPHGDGIGGRPDIVNLGLDPPWICTSVVNQYVAVTETVKLAASETTDIPANNIESFIPCPDLVMQIKGGRDM